MNLGRNKYTKQTKKKKRKTKTPVRYIQSFKNMCTCMCMMMTMYNLDLNNE